MKAVRASVNVALEGRWRMAPSSGDALSNVHLLAAEFAL